MNNPSSSVFDSAKFLADLPNLPGVYCMYDAEAQLLYVGKAISLKARLSSYFKRDIGGKTKALVAKIADIKTTVTASETEALLLESNLIKQHHPRYNILLRDDKSYPFILVTTADEFPRVILYRGKKMDKKKGRLFGPFPSVLAVKEALALLQRIFQLRTCRDSYFQNRKRPCLEYQIGRCSGPCVGLIDKEHYQQRVDQAVLFLSGKSQDLICDLENKMNLAAYNHDYEQAAILRDRIQALHKVREKQAITAQAGNADVIAIVIENGVACIAIVTIRNGDVVASDTYFPSIPALTYEMKQQDDTNEAVHKFVLQAFLAQFYLDDNKVLPMNIVCQELERDDPVFKAINRHRSSMHTITRPRGHYAKWLALAAQNARYALRQHLTKKATVKARFDSLEAALVHPVSRIECFDISHTSGEKTVASCVVFTKEGPAPSLYRQFNIEGITPGDDYAAMKQALMRRYQRQLKEGEALPSLLLIDGGLGQLKQAKAVFKQLEIPPPKYDWGC
jgi:excinuclease ABC subunit C